MTAHLAEISAAVAPGEHAVLVLDGAGWHASAALQVPNDITFLPLPPHSPELNPVENVWQHLRQNRLSLQVWNDYHAILEACCQSVDPLPGLARRCAVRHHPLMGQGQCLGPLV